ncbi:protein CHROMOSOME TRANSMISSION FIDELITY 7 isoform X2 [Hevea brasiliensis]|uniref:protein CHROMOSOME TRANSMISSION FIDELITY 7 isoform X2 n=1 Tax=Hevea brasiliensis TaxID=3981 RepID=UPI0025D8381F|nr:protein CHROMOSOME TRANSMISSION FIDELITY 7 isoform X2 [Hevea brasiliensis]
MQSKISSFFKPSSSSSSIKSDQCLPLGLEDDDHELALWENAEHQFVNTYKRRAPKSHDGDKSVEANRRPVSDVLTIPILKDPCMKPESTSSGKVLNKKSYAQLHLDLGQSDFNLRTCSTCGVKYAPGEEGDEKNHKTFHRNYTFGVQYKCCRKERVVHMPCSHGGSIVLVLNGDPPAQRKKVQEIVKLMEIELGGGWIFHKLCKRVAGCLVAEPIEEAFKIIPCLVDRRSDGATTKDSKLNSTTLRFGEIILQKETTKKVPSVNFLEVLDGNNNGAIICEEKAAPAICGIRAIWVTPSNRRKGIASQLLDAVRRSFCVGFTLQRSQIAFSPPTTVGKALASSYTGTTSFMVYKPNAMHG